MVKPKNGPKLTPFGQNMANFGGMTKKILFNYFGSLNWTVGKNFNSLPPIVPEINFPTRWQHCWDRKFPLRKKLKEMFQGQKRDHHSRYKAEPGDVKVTAYPSYTASVPFKWSYCGTDFFLKALIGHSILAQVAVKDAGYPEGTLKLFPSWVLYYRQ